MVPDLIFFFLALMEVMAFIEELLSVRGLDAIANICDPVEDGYPVCSQLRLKMGKTGPLLSFFLFHRLLWE